MSPRQSAFVWPGPGRITLVLLAVVPAVMAYPWSSTRDRWVLGVAVAALIVLLGWWRGLHFTTILRRRAAMSRHRRGGQTGRRFGPDVRTTALLRVAPSVAGPDVLPLPLIAGYLNRYGLHADTIRITSRDSRSEADGPRRDTWIGLTLSAADNLAALRARSPRIPLQETTEVAARRLADHLRENGWEVTGARPDDVPELLSVAPREGWHGVTNGASDYVAAYRIGVDHTLPDTLAEIWAHGAYETWTAVEFSGTGDHRTLAAGCVLRTDHRPGGPAPLSGLIPQHGYHRSALQALHPLSGRHLDGHTEVRGEDIGALPWPVVPDSSAAAKPGSRPRHTAATRT